MANVVYGSVCYRLFYQTFYIQMQNKFFYTETHMKKLLGLSTGTEEGDRKFLNDYIELARTPVNMAVLHSQGIPFSILYAKDVITIYDLFTKHLNRWTEILSRPLCSIKPPPVEDFMIIENFLTSIRYIAEQLMVEHQPKVNAPEAEFWDFFKSLFPTSNVVSPITVQPDMFEGMDDQLYRPATNIREAWEKSTWGQNYGNS